MNALKAKFTTVDDYIAYFPEEVRSVLESLRQTIREAAPEAQETIKYGMPTYVWHGNLVYFAAFKKHIALYPSTETMEEAISELSAYKTGKGTLQFPLDQPLPLPLIRQVVAFRMQETMAKGKR